MIEELRKLGWSCTMGWTSARGYYADAFRHFPPDEPWTSSIQRQIVIAKGESLAMAEAELRRRLSEKYGVALKQG